VAGSPFLLIQYFELSYRAYGWLFGFTALGIVIGAGVSSGLAKGGAYRAIVHNGVLLALLGAAISGAALLFEVGGLVLVMAGFWLSTFGYGLLMPAASQMALSRADTAAGAVSAGLNTFQMACMTAASAVVAIGLGAAGPTVIVGVMVLFGAAASLMLPLLDEAEDEA
jgi:DHA1 family bicyclomycin/chloramphenicol resistance-like MFS transporter